MKAEEIRKEVEVITENTFKRLQYAYLCSKPEEYGKPKECKNQDISTNLIFPRYHNDEQEHHRNDLRISEQELRFAFAEEFRNSKYSKENKWHYSIETPTKRNYINFSEGEPSVANGNEGRSALFDFVIHDAENKPICLIEFKAHNPNQSDYHKDFEKLIHDEENNSKIVRYFIQVLKSHKTKTLTSIAQKLCGIINDDNKKEKYKKHFLSATPKIEYRCFSLEKGEPITQEILDELRAL